MADYVIVSKNWRDKILKTDLWFGNFLWGTGKRLGSIVRGQPLLSALCCQYFGISRSEWKRKLAEGSIDYGKNGFLNMLARDTVLSVEGFYEVRLGRKRWLAICVPEPWYVALKLRFAHSWNRFLPKRLKSRFML